jgi:Bacterial protein of unknown function (DUF899)
MAAVSRAPYPKLAAYKKRMRWGFSWVSSLGSDFNVDYRVSFTDEKAEKVDYNYRLRPWRLTEAPGISVFLKDGGRIYHTYSTYERGLDMLNVRLPLHGSRTEGPRRGRRRRDHVGSPPRRVSGLMYGDRLFATVGLLRRARPGGFCPACRVLMNARDASQELAKPMVAALIVLVIAGVA